MSNNLCQPQIVNYNITGLSQEAQLSANECMTNSNQQKQLEFLLYALTNQLAIAASCKTTSLPKFESKQLNDGNNNEVTGFEAFGKSENTMNVNKKTHRHEVDTKAFIGNFNSKELNSDRIMASETNTNDLKSANQAGDVKLHKANNLTNLESFNLDTHLDLSRYMYFNHQNEHQHQETDHKVSTEHEKNANIDSCLTVDCHMASSSSSQLSSSSSSSSNSSLSNICKASGQDSTLKSTDPDSKANKNPNDFQRSISFLSHSKLSGHLSSSSDCLSGDEGYFGSYSDKKNYNHEAAVKQVHPAPFGQQEQVFLLKYLLQNQHMTQMNNVETSTPSVNIQQTSFESTPAQSNSNEDVVSQMTCLNIFSPPKMDSFTSLLSSPTTEEYDNDGNTKFDVFNLLSTSEKNFSQHNYEELENLKLKKEIADIMDEQIRQRDEKQRLEELEMQSLNWRKMLDQRARLEKCKREISNEDHVDLIAYLNEIEMNLDHFQYGQEISNDTEDVLIDTLLKFRTNQMAFNLRDHHRYIQMEFERKRLSKENHERNLKMNMFANVHVDSIAEFTPYQDQFYDYETTEEHGEFTEEYDVTYIHEGEQLELEANQAYDELAEDFQYQMLDNDYTMVDESNEVYDENGFLINNGVVLYEDDLVDSADFVDSTDSEYLYEEDYEDYEDQVLVDSLSEQDALKLLRNESEMYALQMAQASKSGLLTKTKGSRKKKGRFNSGTSSTTTQSTDTTNDQKLEAALSNVDIFENVFNYDELVSGSSTSGSNSDLTSTSGVTESESNTNETFDLDINEFLMPQAPETTGNISMSLRNSLLKLRHTRRHLAKLIDSKKPSSGSSSTSSSLTNSGTQLGAQFSKQITISALSRKPCVYMLNEGRCMRADCRFAHDLKQITCKYWIDGECLKGENCEFLHEMIDEPQLTGTQKLKKTQKAIVIKKKDFKLDTEEFPALGGAPPPALPKSEEFPALGGLVKSEVDQPSPPHESTMKKISDGLAIKQPASKNLASVLKTAPSALNPVNVVNLVPNKPQQAKAKHQKPENTSKTDHKSVKSQNAANSSKPGGGSAPLKASNKNCVNSAGNGCNSDSSIIKNNNKK